MNILAIFVVRHQKAIELTSFMHQTSVKAVKKTGSNIVVFCILITILNTLLITMQNVLHLLF